ncbi:MAG: glycine--tRNA ligase, partial [Clostridiaceae bacterium]|nr:glycine--tRNA ligase [Clostridiaceae bacterium]
IYGGLANTWDYGPYGVELKNNIKQFWWRKFITENPLNVGIDAAILMNPATWQASGHLANFADPLVDCKKCRSRYRADQLIDDFNEARDVVEIVEGWSNDELSEYISANEIPCPKCGSKDFTNVRNFNLMFKTFQGVTEDNQSEIYLRPETAQGIFVNFKNVQRTSRKQIPFGIGQAGKSFRNEITPGNFIFRTREFEQLELQFFCEPGTDMEWFEYWRNFCYEWLLELGIKEEDLRLRDHTDDELSHYSVATTDFEFKFPFGWGELWGVANRTDYDLKQHIEHSKKNLYYRDPHTNEEYIPYVIEPSLGVDRMFLTVLCNAYDEEELPNGTKRTVLRFDPIVAPVKVAILPLSAKLSEEAEKIYFELSKQFPCEFDDRQSIGRRYRRHDEIGTPYCVTFDFDSLEDNQVTIRERDSMEQIRIPITELSEYFDGKFD